MLSNQAEHEARKKADGKRSRDDADAVKELLFKAFEKHQYYALKDLHALTKQPMVSIYTVLPLSVSIGLVFIVSRLVESSVGLHSSFSLKVSLYYVLVFG